MKKIFLTVCLVANCLFASAQQWLTPEVESRGNELLSKMTVDEKLSYIVGTDWMYTKNIDRLGINQNEVPDSEPKTAKNGLQIEPLSKGNLRTLDRFEGHNSNVVGMKKGGIT